MEQVCLVYDDSNVWRSGDEEVDAGHYAAVVKHQYPKFGFTTSNNITVHSWADYRIVFSATEQVEGAVHVQDASARHPTHVNGKSGIREPVIVKVQCHPARSKLTPIP